LNERARAQTREPASKEKRLMKVLKWLAVAVLALVAVLCA